MMYNFLTNSIETRQVSELFEEIHKATDKIEYYTKQVALNVGDIQTNLLIKCYETIIDKEVIQDLGYWGIKATPYMIIRNEKIDDICNNEIKIESGVGYSLTGGGPPYVCSQGRYDNLVAQYQRLRNNLLQILEENSYSMDEFLKYEESESE